MDLIYGQFVECSVFHFDSLKHKATVGKDTLNIKKAACCSEVGQVDGMANCKQDRYSDELKSSSKLCSK